MAMESSSNVKSEMSGDILSPSPFPSKDGVHELGPSTSKQSCSKAISDETGDDELVVKDNNSSSEDPIDGQSKKGIFGWETLDNTSIPYLLRRGRKYVSIRIVERKLLSKYPNTSPDDLGKKDPLVSHFITEAEANLLNEINISHCDYEYGQNSFTEKDLVVDLEEFEEFFKIVKKTFPEELLASIKGDVPSYSQPVPTPPAMEPSQCCGWIQINNTVSPYIIRGTGKEQIKLVPLSVIVYAAGLLTNANVTGLHPTSNECRMLNAACKAAGFDFTFGRNTRLIAISEVVQRCQVQIFELPLSNPLQHAHYMDHRMSSILTPALRQPLPPPYPCRSVHTTHPTTVDTMGGRPPLFMNPFIPRMPGHDLPPSIRPGGMISSGGNFDNRPTGPDQKLSNLDPSQLPASIQQALLDKCHRLDSTAVMSTNKMAPNSHPYYWSMTTGQPPPAHSGKMGATSKTPPSPFDATLPSSTPSVSSYQPHSLPPNSYLHPSPLDINHPIYRMPGLQSQSSKDNHLHNSKYGPQGPPPSSSQHHQGTYPTPFGSNQFNSSLFARSDSVESKMPVNQPSSSVITSTHHQSVTQSAIKHQTPAQSQRSSTKTTNSQTLTLVKCITACLVNGKSISCLDIDTTNRKGKYCLVEAVSKLYFPTVPIAEFVKVLQVVLKANLYPCCPDEEAAFVQYYNLPAPRLKCNQMILVEDLKRYFPQLNYVFSKRNHVLSEETNGDRGHKRTQQDTAAVGSRIKQSVTENMVQRISTDNKSILGETAGTSNGGSSGSIIVIDD